MAQLTLPPLPRQTTYQEMLVEAGATQRPAWGGPLLPLERTGDRWAFDVSIPAMAAQQCGARVRVVLAKGKINTVSMAVQEPGLEPRNYGSPRVAVAGQQGTTLPLKGLTPGVVIPDAKWLNMVVSGRHYLYMVDGAVTADGSGNAAVKLWPMIRRSAPLNAIVRLADPVIEGHAALQNGWTVNRFGPHGSVSLNFRIEEAE